MTLAAVLCLNVTKLGPWAMSLRLPDGAGGNERSSFLGRSWGMC